jgi:hypothetical protein
MTHALTRGSSASEATTLRLEIAGAILFFSLSVILQDVVWEIVYDRLRNLSHMLTEFRVPLSPQ